MFDWAIHNVKHGHLGFTSLRLAIRQNSPIQLVNLRFLSPLQARIKFNQAQTCGSPASLPR